MTLHLDFETRCPLDIKKVGLDNYARHASVLMLAWAIDDAPPQLWLPEHGAFPAPLQQALASHQLCAWNAAFERAIFASVLGQNYPLDRWLDPSVIARYAGLPSRLKEVSAVLGLGSEAKHDGARLIRKFSCPQKNGTFRTALTDPDDWQLFMAYCLQDVVAERAVLKKLLPHFALPEREQKLWELDQRINSAGIPVDVRFTSIAHARVQQERKQLLTQLAQLTAVDNPNSRDQMLRWLKGQGYGFDSLSAKRVTEALA